VCVARHVGVLLREMSVCCSGYVVLCDAHLLE